MMGDGSNSGLASGGTPNSFLQPGDEVGEVRVTVYTQFAICFTQFSHSLYLSVLVLHILFVSCSTTVRYKFTLGSRLAPFPAARALTQTAGAACTEGGRPGRRPSRGVSGTALA